MLILSRSEKMASAPRKNGVKPPKGRPPGTSNLSRPPVEDTFPTALSAFSPSGALFALLSLAIDKHRLRVYDTLSGQSTAEYIVDAARVTALTWACLDPSPGQATHSGDTSPDKKKRKKRKSTTASADNHAHPIDMVLLGLSDGSMSIFSPPHCKVLRTFYHPSSSAGIMSIFVNQNDSGETTIWTSSSDSVLRLWNATKNTVIGSWRSHDRIPYSSMAQRPRTPDQDASRLELLVANHTIRLLSAISSSPDAIDSETQKLQELASFAGHASSITHLQWDVSQRPPRRFLSMAEGDRIVYVWQVPPLQDGLPVEGRIVASIPLDSDARLLSFSYSPSSPSDSVKQHILTLSASGKICVFPVPAELAPQASSNKTHRKVPALLARSTISISAKPSSSHIRVVAATFATGQDGQIRVARLVAGIRPIFETLVCNSAAVTHKPEHFDRIIWTDRETSFEK
jgi:U3 small nucleolar RNA-associated protein 5